MHWTYDDDVVVVVVLERSTCYVDGAILISDLFFIIIVIIRFFDVFASLFSQCACVCECVSNQCLCAFFPYLFCECVLQYDLSLMYDVYLNLRRSLVLPFVCLVCARGGLSVRIFFVWMWLIHLYINCIWRAFCIHTLSSRRFSKNAVFFVVVS